MKDTFLKLILIGIMGIGIPLKSLCSEEYLSPNGELNFSEQPYFQTLSISPSITYIYNFLSEEECNYLISIGRPRLQKSMVIDRSSSSVKIDSARTSEGYFFTDCQNDLIIKNIEEKISKLTNIPVENGEALHILRYKEGGEYKPHYDYFDLNTVGGLTAYERGGQRVATLIIYLNTVKEGGATIFPLLDIEVNPTKCNALLFYDCTSEENVDPLTLHGGAPVISGEKWIVTKWLHSRPYK